MSSSDTSATARERIDAAEEQHLRLEDVARAGDDALVEQRVGNRQRARSRETPNGFLSVERRAEQIGAQLPQIRSDAAARVDRGTPRPAR